MAYTYIIRCNDDSLYTGICLSIKERMRDHYYKTAKAAKYTKSRGVSEIMAVWESENLSKAARLEAGIKGLTRKQKIDLIENPSLLVNSYIKHLIKEDYQYLANIKLEDYI